MRFLGFTVAAFTLLFLAGCTIETPTQSRNGITAPGHDVVINEVFRVSLSANNPYSWIELYNPTDKYVPWYTETAIDGITTARERLVVRFRARIRFYASQFFGDQVTFNPSYIVSDSIFNAYFTNYHTDEILDRSVGLLLRDHYYSSTDQFIAPGQFVVIVNDRNKFDEHTLTGPFQPPVFEMTLSFNSIFGHPSPAVILPIHSPIDPSDSKYYWFGVNALWDLSDAGEVALMRVDDTLHLTQGSIGQDSTFITAGDTTYLDVVRYGNFRPSPDPFPGNTPVGDVPAGTSVARYFGYYKTGNSADELYFSPDPIPGWVNQREK